MNKTLKVKLLTDTAKPPSVAHPGTDLGYDLYSDEDITIGSHGQAIVSTGIAIGFPTGFGGIIKDRSSVASKLVYTSGGVIDNGYRGEIKVLLRNSNLTGITIKQGDKIAQMVLLEVNTVSTLDIVDDLEDSARGENGFGSTGA